MDEGELGRLKDENASLRTEMAAVQRQVDHLSEEQESLQLKSGDLRRAMAVELSAGEDELKKERQAADGKQRYAVTEAVAKSAGKTQRMARELAAARKDEHVSTLAQSAVACAS